jgi:hypothetical protein
MMPCAVAFSRKIGGVDTLPGGKHWQRIWVLPAEIVPIRHVFTDPDDEMARAGLLQIDLLEEGVAGGQLEHPSEVKSSTIATDDGVALIVGH